ncbi:MAG: LamG-like jellyroll fold domain-containing protein, partial [Actinomycetota bacterium]
LSIAKDGGSVTITDDIQISASYSDNGFAVDASGGHVEFQGNTSISAGATTFGDVTLDAGAVTLNGDIAVDGDITVERLSRLDGGDIHVSGEIDEIDSNYGGEGEIVKAIERISVTVDEDTPIELTIETPIPEPVDDEEITVKVAGVPEGASLSAGTDGGAGEWSLTPGEFDGVTVTPAANSDADFSLEVSAVRTQVDPGTGVADPATAEESPLATVDVQVDAAADAPSLTATDASGAEDSAIPLEIDAALTDSSETLTVTISNVPDGATLSTGIDNGDGTWSVDPGQLDDITMTPPENFHGDIELTITAESTDGDDVATTSQTVNVNVEQVFDVPSMVVQDASGVEDTPIELDIDVSAGDVAADVTVTVANVPEGATLSAGVDNGDASWTLTASQVEGLTITPAQGFNGGFDLDITTEVAEPASLQDGLVLHMNFDDADQLGADASGAGNDARVANADAVDGAAELDDNDGFRIDTSSSINATTVTERTISIRFKMDDAGGRQVLFEEGGSIRGLNIYTDNGELYFGGYNMPTGESAWNGTYLNGGDVADGEWHTATLVLDGDDTVRPDAMKAYVDGELVATGEGSQLWPHGDPTGVGEVNNDTFFHDGLHRGSGLTFQGSIDDLRVYDRAIDPVEINVLSDGESYSINDTLHVEVEAVADAPTLTASDTAGLEDASIALHIDAATTDAGESLAVTIGNVPDGATLSAGTDNADGSWTLQPDQLDGLSITPPQNFDGSFELTVMATSTDGADAASVMQVIEVDVQAVADAPTVTALDASGDEDTPIALNIDVQATDPSESLKVTISNVPDGATLSAGTDLGGGSWAMEAPQLDGLTITPPQDFHGDFELTVTAISSEAADSAETVQTINVHVDDVIDAPVLSATDAIGDEDTPIALHIDAEPPSGVADADLTITVANVPDGATLSAGSDNGDGSWTLTPDQLDNLTITPPADFSGVFDLDVTVTSGVEAPSVDFTEHTINSYGGSQDKLPVFAVEDDGATLHLEGNTWKQIEFSYTVTEDTILEFEFRSTSEGEGQGIGFDTNNSWSRDQFFKVFGTQNNGGFDLLVDDPYDADGEWQTFQIRVGDHFTGSFDRLTFLNDHDVSDPDSNSFFRNVRVYEDGDAHTVTTAEATVSVDVRPVVDPPSISIGDAFGQQDQPIDMPIRVELFDDSETFEVALFNVPEGAALSTGSQNTDGSWSVSSDQIEDLQITPPSGFHGRFDIAVVVTTSDGDASQMHTQSMRLTVAPESVESPMDEPNDGPTSEDAEQPQSETTDSPQDTLQGETQSESSSASNTSPQPIAEFGAAPAPGASAPGGNVQQSGPGEIDWGDEELRVLDPTVGVDEAFERLEQNLDQVAQQTGVEAGPPAPEDVFDLVVTEELD